jgi:hypothetical protein
MSNVDRTSAGLQIVIPGCERRTLPKSTIRVDEIGQGLLHFYKPPSLPEKLGEWSRGCTFAAEQGTKGNAESWVIRALDIREPPFSEPRRARPGRPVSRLPTRSSSYSSSVFAHIASEV